MNFAKLLGGPAEEFPREVWRAISSGNFKYRVPGDAEQNILQLRVLEFLNQSGAKPVSSTEVSTERHQLWERCYSEQQVIPKFLIKQSGDAFRLSGQYVIPESPLFEADFLAVVRTWLADKYFEGCSVIYEFGCGTGHNLIALSKQLPEKVFMGLDWSESAVELVRKQGFAAKRFDFFDPDLSLYLGHKAGVLTVGALEQVGTRWNEFLYFLLSRRPTVCVHLEPILELYDDTQTFDHLAVRYHKARGYLEGYWPILCRLEQYGLVKILTVKRIPFGSFYHEAYTYIVWRPNCG